MDVVYPVKIVSTQKSNILEIRWMPHNVCNFQCRYCFPGSSEGDDKASSDDDLVIKNFNHLLNYYKKNGNKDRFHIKILGGEPTLWKGLEKFMYEMKSNHNAYITIISNGSRTLRWWKKYGNLIDNVLLSYHVARADLDHHISVADIMFEFGKKVTVLVLMDPTIWDKCVSSIEYMKKNSKHPWFIQAKELVEWNNIEKINYSNEQKRYLSKEIKRYPNWIWFIKNMKLIFNGSIRLFESKATLSNGKTIRATPQTYINNNWTDFKGWSCDVGLDCVAIDSKGNINGSCGQIIYNLDYRYNILDKDFVDKFSPDMIPSICNISRCLCQPENHITKSKVT
jgi:organic radical activating enzyme